MAIKETKPIYEKENWFIKAMKTEYRFENAIFLVLCAILLVMGVLILNKTIPINENAPLIGKIVTPFSITLIVVTSLGVLYGLYPVFKPSFPEYKKITWPTWSLFGKNTIRTFIFMLIFTATFILYDSLITSLLGLILNK